MWPLNPFAAPISSFTQPVTPPSDDPDTGNQTVVCFSAEWLPYVIGALHQLLLQTTWDGDDDTIQLARDRANNLLVIFAQDGLICPEIMLIRPIRYDSGTDSVQTSADDGMTWVTQPQLDARTSTALQLPTRTGDTARCYAAINMLVKLKQIITLVITAINITLLLLAVLEFLSDFIPEIGIFENPISDVLETILSIGESVVEAAFTDAQWAIVECILYCDISEDGAVTPVQLAKILADIASECTATVSDVLALILGFLGNVGLTNAGAYGTVIGDCSGCGDCPYTLYVYDDDLLNQGISDNDGGAPGYAQGYWDYTNLVWQTGVGTAGRAAYWIRFEMDIPDDSDVTQWGMYFNPYGDNTDAAIKGMYYGVDGGSFTGQTGTTTVPNPYVQDISGATAGHHLTLVANVNANSYRTDMPLYQIYIVGHGVPALTGVFTAKP